MNRRPAIVRMKPPLHPGQVEFMGLCREYRFALATCGRRFGKTLYLHQDAFRTAVNHAGAKVWWVDPIHYMAKRAFRMMKKPVLGCRLAEPDGVLTSELRIELINGSVIEFHSAERGDRMRGEGEYAKLIAQRFRAAAKRLGLDRAVPPLRCDLFKVPPQKGDQLSLF